MEERDLLGKVAQIIERELGLYYPESRFKDLEKGLVRCSRLLYNSDDLSQLMAVISGDSKIPDLVTESLTSSLTINETYFFREKPAISFFINKVLPILSAKSGTLSIWSAGCSSGEEPFTIAMLIKEHFPDLTDRIKIIATDISHKAIKKAHESIYSEWSFRETPSELKERYFTKKKGGWKISDDIVKMVSFGYLNLATESYPNVPGGLDAIFCRNVLMYFSPDIINKVSSKLYNSLADNGFLITSQVELNDDYFSLFEKILCDGGIFYVKRLSGSNILSKQKRREIHLSEKSPEIPQKRKINITKKTEIRSVEQKKGVKIDFDPETLYLSGEYTKCIELCEDNLKKNKMIDRSLYLLAKCHANTGEYAKAEESIDKIIKSGIDSEDIYYLYGTLLMEKSNISGAIGALKRGIYINPGHLFSHLLLGNIMKIERERESARRYYNNVLNILSKMNEDDIVPDSGGLTCARLVEMVKSLIREL
jgi:chemotaxis protein methyltransferase CheR